MQHHTLFGHSYTAGVWMSYCQSVSQRLDLSLQLCVCCSLLLTSAVLYALWKWNTECPFCHVTEHGSLIAQEARTHRMSSDRCRSLHSMPHKPVPSWPYWHQNRICVRVVSFRIMYNFLYPQGKLAHFFARRMLLSLHIFTFLLPQVAVTQSGMCWAQEWWYSCLARSCACS
jgi:hypothetical protein